LPEYSRRFPQLDDQRGAISAQPLIGSSVIDDLQREESPSFCCGAHSTLADKRFLPDDTRSE
jgi:hypothetical protein